MNRKEAKMSLDRGYRLTHRHFSDDEWIEKSKEYSGRYLFEDGNVGLIDDFWKYRKSDSFDTDWSIKPQYAISTVFTLRHKPSIFSEEIIDEVVIIKEYRLNAYCLSKNISDERQSR